MIANDSAPHDGLDGEGSPTLTAEAIARMVGGQVVGDGSVVLRAVAPLDRARADELTFLAHERYAPLLASTGAPRR